MSKNHIAALHRAENRIARALELDDFRMSRGVKTRLEGALKDVNDVIAIEKRKAYVPVGHVQLHVLLNTETAEALWEMRNGQKSRSGGPITLAETVRRCIALTKWIFDERRSGRVIISQEPDGTKRRELVVL